MGGVQHPSVKPGRNVLTGTDGRASDPVMDQGSARAHHDLGGVDRFMCVPVDTEPHGLTDFDKQVDALRQLLGAKGVMSVDELRRGVEAIPEEEYFALTYYQKWLRSITDTLLRKGVIDAGELRQRLDSP